MCSYGFKLDNDSEVKKAKGTKKCTVKNHITFNDYVNILFNDNKLLRSHSHLKVTIIKYTHRKLIRLHWTILMIKEYNAVIK